jgi:phage regulator Rha-like protein
MTKKEIKVKNLSVAIKTGKENDDFICLTDMAKFKGEETGIIIANWLTTKFTLEFIGIWEEMNNPNFNLMEFHNIKNHAGSNGFIVSSSKWINSTNSIGIRSNAGRYGGTYAHKDIAFEFASWLSPEFKLYLIKEFQRLKEQEKQTTHSLEWKIKRSLAKTNYRIHTDSIAKKLEGKQLAKWQESLIYADEADMLNLILWGRTAKEWEAENPQEVKQNLNIRDVADIVELIVLSNLETLNARFIDEGKSKTERSKILSEIAIQQKTIISKNILAKN